MIVKSVHKLNKWYATLTLVASTVDEYSSTKKLVTHDFIIIILHQFFYLLGQALRPEIRKGED